MLRDSLVTLLKQRLKRANTTAFDTIIETELQYVQDTLEAGITLPWFLLSENLSAITTIGDERVPVPVNVDGAVVTAGQRTRDFLREYEEGALWWRENSTDDWVPLKKGIYEHLLVKYPGSGSPKGYALDGMYFRIRHEPDKEYNLRIKCYLREPLLTSNIENNWLIYAPDLMLEETGIRVARYHLRDEAAAKMFEADAAKSRMKLFIIDEARKHTNFEYEMGSED